MGWSMASYQKAMRRAQPYKKKLTWKGTIMHFIWHSMVTASRILSISMALAMFPTVTTAAGCIHWYIMMSWLSLWGRTNFCSCEIYSEVMQQVAETLFCGILGFVYIFMYVSPNVGQKRTLYTFYYVVYFVENLLAAAAWSTADTVIRSEWYFYPLLVGCVVPFVIGIGFMLLYYSCFHPTLPVVKCCDESNDSGDVDLHTFSKNSAEDNFVTHNETASEANETVNEHKIAVESKC